jgi:Protein of unknown function (DUF3048) N-terminal domain/Protein of unknown function (DUF3048) C-terminal domain
VRLPRAPLALAGLIAFNLPACTGGGAAGEATVAPPSTTGSTAVAGGTVAGSPLAPLTGLPDPSGVTTTRPALSVKVDNAPDARPQAGLELADVVFEEVVEGGATRFIAVFHSAAPDTVGPIRSVRSMDPHIASALGGLFAYSGGIPQFVSLIRKVPVQDVGFDVATGAYRKDPGRPKPHHLFASPAALWGMAKDRYDSPPPALFGYRAPGEAFGEADATTLRIPYSQLASAGYSWDAPSGTWKRTQDGAPHLTVSGTQIAPENLIVAFVSTRRLGYVDQSGAAVFESVVIGGGDAWILSGGRITKGKWSKAGAESPALYTDAGGNPVKLMPGHTWVHYAPVGSPVSVR